MPAAPSADALIASCPAALQKPLRAVLEGDEGEAGDAAVLALREVGYPLRREQGIAVPAALEETQVAVARVLALRAGLDVSSFAMPAQARARKRWIGLAPPGVLEEELGKVGAREPRWAFYARCLRDGQTDLVAQDLETDPVRKTEALVECALGAYELAAPAITSRVGVLVDQHAAGLLPYAKRLGPELVALFKDRRKTSGRLGDGGPRAINDFHWYDEAACAAAYLPLVAAGEPFDSTLVPLLSFRGQTHARSAEVVAWLPEVERDALATQVFMRSNVQAVPLGSAILARFTLPGLAAAMLERYNGGKPDGQTPPSLREAWKKALEDLAERRPEVAPLLAPALSPAKRAALGLTVAKKKPSPKKPKWAAPAAGASLEARLASFEDAIARALPAPEHTFMKALDELLLDVFGRAWRPLPRRRPASLTDQERRALKAYTDYGVGMYPHLAHAGLPSMREPTRQMLGLAAPGPEDALIEVGGETLPVWCAAADAVYGAAPLGPLVAAIARLPNAEQLWTDFVQIRGSITWAPIAPERKGLTGVTKLADHGPAFVRFLGTLGAAVGPAATRFARKRLAAELETANPSAFRALVDVVVLARAGMLEAPMDAALVLLVKARLPPELLACVREVLPPSHAASLG